MKAVLFAVALFAVAGCRSHEQRPEDIAQLAVRKLAFEAYPQWTVTNRQACPANLAELGEYVPDVAAADPWKHPYEMLCGDQLPEGARGIAVYSRGRDGEAGTADDIRSWH
jgi:hypothetical protein